MFLELISSQGAFHTRSAVARSPATLALGRPMLSCHVGLLCYQLFIFQTGHRKFRRCIKQTRILLRGAIF